MKKKRIIFISLIVIMIIASTAIILAAPSINLSVTTNNNTANLSWTNNDSVKSYNYDVQKSVNGGSFSSLTGNEGNEVTVLNVYPDSASVDQTTTFTTYDGENITIKKSASLKEWMEKPNSTDSRGWGRGLIEVTPVSITDFNANPSAYLKKVNGKYNYDVVVFGTWDAYGGQDISDSARSVMNTYLAEGNSCVMGHDTIRGDGGRAANFAALRSYFNIKTALDDGVTNTSGVNPGNINGDNTGSTTQVKLRTNNVFTTYPWSIGSAGTILTVPQCHCVQQVAYGNVEITFANVSDITDQNGRGNWNYYLTVNNNCAMIQTGHSSGAATADEQKIWANLLFYLGDINNSTTAVDNNFVDIDAPNIPTILNASLQGLNGSVSYSATDNGTTYNYYVVASERVSLEKTSSNTITKVRKTEVAGYSYVIDTSSSTTPDGTIDTTSTSINYTLGNGPKTYLHIRAVDGAGNAGPTAHVLLHENVPPELTLSQNPTEWTNGNVVITATASDSDGEVVSIKRPDGTVVSGSSTTYEVESNGTYEFVATDNSGATTTKSITITNIDKVKPEATTSVEQPTETVRGATITINATDDASGVAKIVKPDGTEVTDVTTTYVVTIPGEYSFTIYDVAGNSNVIKVPVTIVSEGVEVKYIDQVTQVEIADKVDITGNVGENYTTTAKAISGYELVLTPNNANGMLAIDKITVVYEYRKQSDVTAKYIDEITGSEITNSVTKTYKEGDPYTTEQKTFGGYTLTRTTENTTGTVGRANIEVVYYYKKNATIIAKYIDKYTTDKVAEEVTIQGLEKDPYTTEQKTVSGYAYDSVDGNTAGEMPAGITVITYYYIKESDVTVKYIDENTGNEIDGVDSVTTTYKEKDPYTTEKKTIEGYTYTRDTENTSGTVGRTNIEVIYYYKRNSEVTAKYIDKNTQEVIASEVNIKGLEGDAYTTSQKDIEGYVYDSVVGDASGNLKANPTEVIYYYIKQSKVITKYVDMYTDGEIAERVNITYKEGDLYSTTRKNITGYTYEKVTENASGTVAREDIEVTYYYKKNTSVAVKYIDIYTDEEIADSEKLSGVQGDPYTTIQKDIDSYKFVEVSGDTEGNMGADPKEIVYKYVKQADVYVECIDEITGVLIGRVDPVRYSEKENYTTESLSIEGYTLTRNSGNTSGVMGRENILVKYYYKKNTSVTVKYIDMVTKEEIANKEVITGLEKQDYETSKKTITGYEYIEVTGKTSGQMEREPQEVVYKYKKQSNLITEHIDANSGEKIIDDIVKTYKEGDTYEALAQNLGGYILVEEPETKTGIMEREDIVKTFKYK
ncbi:MAG: MucBP domain-containing protein, partial [Clostridia bacterium]